MSSFLVPDSNSGEPNPETHEVFSLPHLGSEHTSVESYSPLMHLPVSLVK